MKNLLMILGLFLISAGNPVTKSERKKQMEDNPDVTLTVLYDNYQFDGNFKNSWGFSCLIEGVGKTVLFDTGGKDGNLMQNFKVAGKDPADVDLVILSHNHWDHVGGLPEFLEFKTGIEVFMPASFPETLKKEVISKGAHPVEIQDFQKITDHVWTTGEMGEGIIEQSLVIETNKGLVILTGCAHPGIEKIVEKSMEEKGDEVLLVMGGFHLLRTGTSAVDAIARDFINKKIKYASPTHCSGDATIRIFSDTFGEHYIRAGAGKVIHTSDL